MKRDDLNSVNFMQFMPTDSLSLKILNERAERFSKLVIKDKEEKEILFYAKVILGKNQLYGIPYYLIGEIFENKTAAKVPFVSDFVEGVINHRGMILTIVNLTAFLKIDSDKKSEKYHHLIMINYKSQKVAFLVNEIIESCAYEKDELYESPLERGHILAKYILGIHQGKVAILNLENIMLDLESSIKILKLR